MIKKIDIEAGKRVFVVGDIHGEITALNEKLIEIGFDKSEDLLFSVGDLIDRGENSLACLELLKDEPWFFAVQGNHEDLMINSIINKSDNHLGCWLQNGGQWYFDLNQEDRMYANDLVKLAADLPLIIEINQNAHKTVICHADYPLDEYTGELELDYAFDVIWSRDRINKIQKHQVSDPIKGADLFVFGHTPLRRPLQLDNCMWIDTGAVFGKELSIIEITK
ncbi:calcineurin-like phosphoesterase [Vibrio phage 1.086.O._10N.222.51.F8]|nr:calcineurin-like phosphoesterase [Vibrio phage 1.086.O._10N.222.51.F8]